MKHDLRNGRGARLAAALLAACLVAVACGGSDDDGDLGVDSLEIVTAPTGSVFYPIGLAVATQLEAELGIPVTASPSAGSGENVVLLTGGDAELGVVAANALVPAYAGVDPYDQAYPDLRPIARLFPSAVWFFARADSGLERVSDLAGARVGIGLEARTWQHFMEPAINSQPGLVYGENVEPVYAGFADQANMVRDGQLDAGLASGGADTPGPAFSSLAAEIDLVVLEWDEAGLEQFASDIGFINTFPDYPGDDLPGYGPGTNFFTFDVGGPYIVTTAALPDDVVYEITRIFHQSLPQMAADAAQLGWVAEAGDANLVTPLGDMPFHDGAVRYWEEIGVWGQ